MGRPVLGGKAKLEPQGHEVGPAQMEGPTTI